MAFALSNSYDDYWLLSMAESLRQTLLGSFRLLLRPLVRILVRQGVSYSEFEETSKIVFVEVAESAIRGARDAKNIEEVSKKIGIETPEVNRIKAVIAAKDSPSNENLNRIGRILSAWHQDPLFTGPYGLPLELPFEGLDYSFSELTKRYCPDSTPKQMYDELLRVGAINELPGGRIRVLTRSYIPAQSDAASFQFMGVALRDLAETLDANLNEDEELGYFERRVWTPNGIDRRDMPLFDELVNEKGQEFLETLDNWLSARESESESVDIDQKVHVGVGIYLFSDEKRTFKEN